MPSAKKSSALQNQIVPGAYEKTLVITYRWRCDNFPEGIPQPLREALDETAQDRAFEMIQKGFTSGELVDHVNMKIAGFRTPADGFYCKGWFELKLT